MQHSRSWRVDAGLIAVAAALGGLFFWDRLNTDPPQSVGVITDLAVGTLACAALLLRRRWPVAVAIALLPGILISSMSLGATAVAMSAVALYRSRAVTIAIVAGHTALLALIFSAQGEVFWEGIIALLALDATMVTSGWLVRSERQRQVAAQREERTAARARAEDTRHAERERIAREMHDILAHRLSLLAVYAGAFQVRRSAPQEEREAAAVIRQGAFEALQELREVIWMLRDPVTSDPATSDPATGDPTKKDPAKRDPAADGPSASHPVARERDRPQPTLSDLPALIEQSRLAGTPVGFDNRIADPAALAPNIGRHLYRVIQEGLTNARKHAPGAPVCVSLADHDGVSVEITNPLPDGAVTAIPGAGAGLVGLHERMTLIGGRLDFGLTTANEFRLRAWIPSQP